MYLSKITVTSISLLGHSDRQQLRHIYCPLEGFLKQFTQKVMVLNPKSINPLSWHLHLEPNDTGVKNIGFISEEAM